MMFEYIIIAVTLVVVVAMGLRWFLGTHKMFKDAVAAEFKTIKSRDKEIITEADIQGLPVLIQRYLRKTGSIGQPKVKYFHVNMTGDMKLDQKKPYAPIKAEQYTFIDSGTRLFYITMNFMGLQISGLHHYNSVNAFMKIKILDLIKVVDHSGADMLKAETVTYFNDLCLMAPGGLLEENITWEEIDESSIKGTLSKHGYDVSAVLHFNEDGMLDNFISNDRADVSVNDILESKPWSTPLTAFGPMGNYYLPKAGSAVWHYPKEDFRYIRLNIEKVTVNTP